jgi:ankyrin repeat protein
MLQVGRDDLVGYVIDKMNHLQASTSTNFTSTLHLAAMNSNEKVIEQLLQTKERQQKILEILNQPNKNGDTRKHLYFTHLYTL